MIHLLLVLFLVTPLLAAQAVEARTGSLTGVVTGNGQAAVKSELLSGLWVTLNRLPLSGETGYVAVSRRRQTAKDGTYTFDALPLGRYEVCPQIADSLYLNPCEWPDNSNSKTVDLGPLATLTAARANVRLDLELQTGVILNLRLEDSGRNLEKLAVSRNERAPYAGVVLANGRRAPAKPIYSRNGVYIYSVLVPHSQALRPVIESASLDLEDTARQRLPQGLGAGLTLAPGQAPTEVIFRVAGVKP